MRIDSSGNVGIGTTSPANTLTVGNLEASSIYADATVGIKCDTNHKGLILQENSGAEQWSMGVNANGDLNFYDSAVTDPLVTFADGTGNVGIGTDSPSYPLHVKGADASILIQDSTTGFADQVSGVIFTCSGADGTPRTDIQRKVRLNGDALTFTRGPSDTEHLRIDSSGNLLVGTTNANLYDDTAGSGIALHANGRLDLLRGSAANAIFNRLGTDGEQVIFRKDGTTVGSISVTASATAYNTSSDERLKENIQDADDAGSKIDAIQIRQFDWKSDGSHQDYGVIAQELLEVAPEAVSEGETEDDMMSVDYSKLVPTLIKEIQTLRNRVAQLENN